MSPLLETYWPLLAIALVAGLILAWYLFHATRRTRISGAARDVLDEGAAPAERNKALIDSAPAATRDAVPVPPVTPQGMAGVGEVVSAAAEQAAIERSGDDLTRLKGVGPKLVAMLADLGVTSFAQIAAWDEADIDRIDAHLGRFSGRIRRDDWIGQARLLAANDTAGYAARYGAIE